MLFKFVTALTLSSAFSSDVALDVSHNAASVSRGCGTKSLTAEEKAVSRKKVEDKLKELRSQGYDMSAKEGFSIDVYFHIMKSSSGEGDVTTQQITDQIAALNTAFSPRGWTFTLKEVNTVVNDEWYDGENEYGYKNALRRGTGEDLNFYTGALNQYLGWAYYPTIYCCGNEYLDGVVVDYRSLPGGSMTAFNEGDTGVHEVGHWLGLQHTFDDGCHTDPNGGDEVADTPQVATANYNCDTPVDSCPDDGQGNDLLDNFMDYVYDSCMDSFTAGQLDRAHDQFLAYRQGTNCVLNCYESPTTAPTLSPGDEVSVWDTFNDVIFSHRRGGWASWAGTAATSKCVISQKAHKLRVESFKLLSVDGKLYANINLKQSQGFIWSDRTTLRITLGKEYNVVDGGASFVWTQGLFEESDYVEFLSDMPDAGKVPAQTHSISIKLEYGNLVDSNGNAFSFTAGEQYFMQVGVEVVRWNSQTLAQDCGRVSGITLR